MVSAIQSKAPEKNLTRASTEWAERPADQRFWTIDEMHAKCLAYASRCVQADEVDPRALRFEAVGPRALIGRGPEGGKFRMTHHSFAQVALTAGAPADYLRSLPAERTADLLNFHFHQPRAAEDSITTRLSQMSKFADRRRKMDLAAGKMLAKIKL